MKVIIGLFVAILIAESQTRGINLFEKISSDISKTRQQIHCGVHSIGNTIFGHEHRTNPCNTEQSNEAGTQNVIDENIEIGEKSPFNLVPTKSQKAEGLEQATNVRVESKSPELQSTNVEEPEVKIAENSSEKPLITVESSTTSPEIVTVPGGKRILTVRANCGPGQRGDSQGNCRDEY